MNELIAELMKEFPEVIYVDKPSAELTYDAFQVIKEFEKDYDELAYEEPTQDYIGIFWYSAFEMRKLNDNGEEDPHAVLNVTRITVSAEDTAIRKILDEKRYPIRISDKLIEEIRKIFNV